MSYAGHIIGGPADPDYHGAVLTADLAIGDMVLHVDDVADFDEDAAERDARIMLGVDSTTEGALDASTATSLAYVTCDDDASTVTLLTASTVAASSGDRIYVQDPVSGLPVVDYVVMVALDDGDTTGDSLPVTLSSGLASTVGDLSDLSDQSITFEEDDDGELIATDLPGASPSTGAVKAYQDSLTVTALGDQTLRLTYRPLPDTSVHLYWNGVFQPDDQWTRDGWAMTIPDGSGYIEVGDELVAKYLYTDPTTNPIECRQISFIPGDAFVSGAGDPTAPPANPGSVVVGVSDQWSDASDATYSTMVSVSFSDDQASAPVPTLAAMGVAAEDVTAAEIQCRVSSSASGDAFLSGISSATFGSVFGNLATGPFTSDTPNEITDLVLPIDTSSSPFSDMLGALAGPDPLMTFVMPGGSPDLTVYEAVLVLTVCKPASEWV